MLVFIYPENHFSVIYDVFAEYKLLLYNTNMLKILWCNWQLTSSRFFPETFAFIFLSSWIRMKSLCSKWSLSMVLGRSFAAKNVLSAKSKWSPVSISFKRHLGQIYSAFPSVSLLLL